MHDYFDILGLPTNARAIEVRRACARRIRRTHPDFSETSTTGAVAVAPVSASVAPVPSDLAIDFIDVATLSEGMLARFFCRQFPPADDR